MSKKTVYLFRGLPGAGKSTFISSNKLVDKGYAVVSPDAERAAFPLVVGEFGFPVYDQNVSRIAWQNAYLKMALALAEGKNVVFDATFMSAFGLADAQKHIPCDVETVVVDFSVNSGKATTRNLKRWKTPGYVPASVIRRMEESGKKMDLAGLKVLSPQEFAKKVA